MSEISNLLNFSLVPLVNSKFVKKSLMYIGADKKIIKYKMYYSDKCLGAPKLCTGANNCKELGAPVQCKKLVWGTGAPNVVVRS